MDLAAAFYISVYCLAALAGGILAWAEYVPSVTMLTTPIAIALLFLNERYRLIRLDGGWVALAGFAAFAFPVMEFFRGDEEFRLLSGAHLLVILQWVLLAYHKTAHQYWWICALSCLQVAIAAVLTTSPIFGVFILIYMFWALWTLSLFTLLLARLRFGLSDQDLTQKSGWQWPELTRTAKLSAMSEPPVVSNVMAQAADRAGKRLHSLSEFRGTFQCEPHETDLNWRFVFGISGMSSVALVLGLILFLLTPRVWINSVNPLQDDNSARSGRRNVTGFSENVRLNDFGKILESSAPVMELKLFDDATDAPLSLLEAVQQVGQEEALLRGAALALYDRGLWKPFEPRLNIDIPTGPSLFNPQAFPLIRQEIRLEPMGSNTLFTLGHPRYVKVGTSELRAKEQTHTGAIRVANVTTRGASVVNRINYTVWSPKKDAGKMRVFEGGLAEAYSWCPPHLTNLIAHTKAVLEPIKKQAGKKPLSPSQIAQALVKYLRESGKFHYSLDRTVIDPHLDPVEDFLIHRKNGHCQYFASALALMLRVERIPSCVITGFKGGIEDPDGLRQRVEIQQRHAHAWVEAYLDGAWVTLDPTPSNERDQVVEGVGDRLRFWHRLAAFGSMLWSDYVINLSFTKQQQDLYGPAQDLFQSIASQTKEASSLWRGLVATARQFWSQPERWFSWQGGLVAFLLMLSLASIFQLIRLIRNFCRQLWNDNASSQQQSLRVEFHQRFLALLKPFGLVPKPTQTQREFAIQVAEGWDELGLPPKLQPLAAEVAKAYDGIRFGDQALDEAEKFRLLELIGQLEFHIRQLALKTA
jgi:hypothetical protein